MQINTKQFGELEIAEDNVVYFQDGLAGFEELKKFLLVYDKDLDPFYWLLSLDDLEIELPLMNPFIFFADYNPQFEFDTKNKLIFSVVTMKKDLNRITANLKGPIIIDIENKTGKQVILNSDEYSTQQHIFKFNKT